MNVTLCSAFRNSVTSGHLERYLEQVWALHGALDERGDTLHCVWGEGDSSDDTRAQLVSGLYGWEFTLADCTHGGPAFESIESQQRFRQLAKVGNAIWAVIPEDTDAVIYVESDLIWEPATLLGLLDALTVYPAVTPLIMDSPPAQTFYDVWAYRRNGVRFTKQPPYCADLRQAQVAVGELAEPMLKLDSAGSCIALRWKLAQWLHFPEDCFVGFCRLLYEKGGELYLCPDLTVFHP